MEEEISLRELIEILIRGKWLIAIITMITVAVSGILSFFVISPTYEAAAILMASPLSPKSQPQGSDYETLLNYLSQFPQMTLETYRAQVTNPHILNSVIKELNLDTTKYSVNSLKEAVSVEAVKDTNLIRITVKDKDPQMAANIANTLSSKFVEFVSETLKAQMGKTAEYLESQMKEEQKNLDQITEEMKNFMAKPQSVDELSADIQAKLALLTEFKTELAKLEVHEKAVRSSLETIEKRLSKEPRLLELKKSIIDDPAMMGIASGKVTNSDITGLSLKTQEINQTYDMLSQKAAELEAELAGIISQKAAIENSIKKTQSELESLQALYAEKKTEYSRLQEKYNIALETYNTFLKKYQEARITTSGKIGDFNIMVVSPAIVPEKPVAPKKLLNVALATVLGLMVGVFAVFFADYWKRSGEGLAKTSAI
ncbi:Wzz/FepE/Etk N-terminal domain-containing protein [Thermovorax subterraneus]|nr:Wzz/FepE/Etk N-terminal domain-containing protein [Thermovorax subterraneus]